MQVLNIIDYFTQLATLHSQIESFKTGDVWEVAIAGEDIYPQLWLDQIFNYQENRGVCNWNVSFMILAKQLQDESNENTQLDLAHTIGLEVIEKIKQDNLYQINDQFNAVSFTEAFEDFLCGWRFEIELSIVNNIDRCDIPGFIDVCSYQSAILAPINTTIVNFTTNEGAFTLPSLPAEFASLDLTGLQALRDNLIAEFEVAGFIGVTIDIKEDDPNELIFIIKQTPISFLYLNGDNTNIPFITLCDCIFEAEAREGFTGDALDAMFVNLASVPLPSLPLDLKLTNVNYATDLATLQAELISLGYEATVIDTSVLGGPQFRAEIKIKATGKDVWRVIQGPEGFDAFELECTL